MRARFSLTGLALVCALGLGVDAASANDHPDPGAAIAAGEDGIREYDRGRWDDAYLRFEAAERLAHSPVFVLFMARCRRNAGKLLQARALYRKVAGEAVAAAAPEPMRRAPVEAAAELDELERRIPSIVVVVTGAGSERASVRIDGSPVSHAALARAIPLDPGQHRIQAQVGPGATTTQVVFVSAGDAPLRVVLALDGPKTHPPPRAETGASEWRASVWPGAITLGAGIAGLGVGAVTGAIAAAKTSEIKQRCVGVHCPAEDADDADRAKTLATVSSVSFAVGAALTIGGVVLLATRPDASTRAAVVAGPGRIAFAARF